MAVTGAKFLELNGVDGVTLTGHARWRLARRLGVQLTEEEAVQLFLHSRHLRPEHMIVLGYRPAYGRRLRRGEKSWYFRLFYGDEEAIAVVSQDEETGEIIWVTTYGRNAQTDQLCAIPYEALAAMA